MIDSTKMLRNIYEQVLYEQIDKGQKVDFNYPIGFVAALELSQQTDNSYEQVVTDVFKPFYQTLINDGKVGHWGFMHVILPYGNDVNTTHTSFLFFKDMNQLANFMIESNYPTFIKSTPEFETGLKTRDLKKLIIAKLIMKRQLFCISGFTLVSILFNVYNGHSFYFIVSSTYNSNDSILKLMIYFYFFKDN